MKVLSFIFGSRESRECTVSEWIMKPYRRPGSPWRVRTYLPSPKRKLKADSIWGRRVASIPSLFGASNRSLKDNSQNPGFGLKAVGYSGSDVRREANVRVRFITWRMRSSILPSSSFLLVQRIPAPGSAKSTTKLPWLPTRITPGPFAICA